MTILSYNISIEQPWLGINATVVDEGIPITGENSLALPYYYNRVLANLEDYYWNLKHVS